MICSSCNAEIADSSKFCPECGAKLNSATVCSNCGFQNGSVFKFCPECGIKQEEKSPEVVARLQELEKLTPHLEALVSAILNGKTDKDDSANSIFPFMAKCFRNLYTAYNANAYNDINFFRWSSRFTILKEESFADFSLTSDELIENLKQQLLKAAPQPFEEENLIAKSLQDKYGIDCSDILYDEHGCDESCLEYLDEELNSLFQQIRCQAAYYPELKQAIDDLDNYTPKESKPKENQSSSIKKHFSLENILEAGRIAAGLYFGHAAPVLKGVHNLASNIEVENQNEIEEDDDCDNEYNQLLENYKTICLQIMNIAEDGVNAATQFEIAFSQWLTSSIKDIKDFAKNEYSVCYRLLEKGFSIAQIAESIDERTKKWNCFQKMGDLFNTDDDDDEKFMYLEIYDNALDALAEKDDVKASNMWYIWTNFYRIAVISDLFMYGTLNNDYSDFEYLTEEMKKMLKILESHKVDEEQEKQILSIANMYFENSSTVYVYPDLDDEEEKVDMFSISEYFDLETLEKMRDAIAKDLWLEEISFSIYDRDSNVGIIAAQDTLYIKALDQSWSLKYSQINNVNFYKTSSEFSENYCLRVNQYGFQFTSVMEADLRTFCDFINHSKNSLL